MIDAALRYQKDPDRKTKWNLIEAAGEIPMLRAVIYVSDFSENVHTSRNRRSNIGISASFNGKTRAVSSVFLSLENPRCGYGDICGTADLLLFRFSEDGAALEVFLLEGRKGLGNILVSRFLDRQLDEPIRQCRQANGKHNNPSGI